MPRLGGAGRVRSCGSQWQAVRAAYGGSSRITVQTGLEGVEDHGAFAKVTGLRGLTAIPNPTGPGEVLLAGVEDNPARVYRIDPHNTDSADMYASALELDVSEFVGSVLSTPVTYAGIAYNDTIEYPDQAGKCATRLLGIEAITRGAARTFGRQHFNANGYYLVRDCGKQVRASKGLGSAHRAEA